MLIYILKFSACLFIFMAFYKLFLERETMHQLKRFYLLFALVLSIGFPLITFTQFVEPVTITQNFTNAQQIVFEHEAIEQASLWDYLPQLLWTVYGIGVLIFSLKFVLNLNVIFKKIHCNPKLKAHRYINVLLNDEVTPHTFFNYIFLNKYKYESQQIPQEVFIHEQTHAEQKHSLDILFIELLQILFWFNPLLYFIKRDIKLNHEFLADKAVLLNGIQPSQYQQLLLAFSSNTNEPQLANAINYSSIKKRFTIMKTQTSKQKMWLRSFLLLPLVALTLYGFSDRNIELKQQLSSIINNDKIQDVIIKIDKNQEIFLNELPIKMQDLSKEINKLNTHLTLEQKRKFLYAEIYHHTNTTKELVKFIQETLRESDIWNYSTANLDFAVNGKVKIKSPHLPFTPLSELSDEDKTIYYYLLNNYREWLKVNKPNRELEETKNGYIIKDENNKIIMSTDPEIEAIPIEEMLGKNSEWSVDVKVDFTEDSIQQKATPEEVAEYNKLAKKYNAQPKEKRVVKLDDLKRLEYIYNKMSKDQKASSEPFPDCPPPPPAPKVIKGKELPPPPPIPADATPAQKKKMQNAVDDYNNKVPPPPPPPAPKSALDHVIEMAKKGASFYYEGKSISSDEAISLLKKNDKLNISTKESNSKQPKVYITTKPIVIKN
jgi:bla regulator protein BlaR1